LIQQRRRQILRPDRERQNLRDFKRDFITNDYQLVIHNKTNVKLSTKQDIVIADVTFDFVKIADIVKFKLRAKLKRHTTISKITKAHLCNLTNGCLG